MSIDLDAIVAIDVHVHVEQDLHGHLSMDDELLDAASKYFKGDPYHPTVPQIAADYREKNMAAVIFTVDAEAATGHRALSNEEIADLAADLRRRDEYDSSRADSPLRPAEDAVVVDSTHLDREGVVDRVVELARETVGVGR